MSLLSEAHVEVGLESLSCEAIIGIYPHERSQAQPLNLSLSLSLDSASYWSCASSGDLSRSINYAALRQICLFLAQEGHFRLLEGLTATLARAIFFYADFYADAHNAAPLLGLTLKASKPAVFGDGSNPSVSVSLRREQLPPLPPPPKLHAQLSWETRSVEANMGEEPSTAPKRLSQGPAELLQLCVSPEVKVFGLRARAQKLSALSPAPSSVTLILTGKWYGIQSVDGSTARGPQALQEGEVVRKSDYQELWCLEGGLAITLNRA